MPHSREDELLAALPPPAAENLRKVLTDPELDRWVRMPTQIAFRTAMAAVDLARDRFPLPDSLTPAQRAFLEIVLERPELAPVLPGARWSLRRWLGMDPPGALERVVTHDVGGSRETSPRWRAYDAARGNPAEIARLLEALSMAERLEVYGELDAGAYGFTPRDLEFDFPGLEALREEGRAWAPRHADWLLERAKDLGSPYDVRQRLRIRPPLFLSFVRSHIASAPRWEVFLPLTPERPELLRECFAALPEGRRVQAVRAALPTSMPEQAVKLLLALIELYPLPGFVDIAFERHLGHYAPKKETLAALDNAAKRHPELAEALATNRQKKPLKLKLEVLSVPSESKLTSVQKAQVAKLDERTFENLAFYRVTDAKGAPLYDAVLFADTDGQVFTSGTSDVVAMIAQQGVEADDGALSMALEQAFDAHRKKAKAKKSPKKGG